MDRFIQTINSIYCKSFPLKTKYISVKRLSKPWPTKDLLHLIKQKSLYFKLYKAGIISKTVNYFMKNKVNSAIIKAKQTYYLQKFSRLKSCPRKAWNLIHQLSGQKKSRETVDKLYCGDGVITDDLDIAEQFNSYFSSVADDLESNLPEPVVAPLEYVNGQSNCSFNLYPTSECEVNKIITGLKTVYTDLNEVPVKIFVRFGKYFARPLSKRVNKSYKAGHYPTKFKTLRLTPVFKTGDKLLKTNYL